MCALPIVFIMKLVRVPASLTHGVMIHELIETIGHLSIFLRAMEPHFAWRGVGVGARVQPEWPQPLPVVGRVGADAEGVPQQVDGCHRVRVVLPHRQHRQRSPYICWISDWYGMPCQQWSCGIKGPCPAGPDPCSISISCLQNPRGGRVMTPVRWLPTPGQKNSQLSADHTSASCTLSSLHSHGLAGESDLMPTTLPFRKFLHRCSGNPYIDRSERSRRCILTVSPWDPSACPLHRVACPRAHGGTGMEYALA